MGDPCGALSQAFLHFFDYVGCFHFINPFSPGAYCQILAAVVSFHSPGHPNDLLR